MPRRSKGPRLYFDRTRRQFVIRDGQQYIRTSCSQDDRGNAEQQLGEYIARKYTPTPGPSPSVADVLLAYARGHLPSTAASANTLFNISNLAKYWGDKNLSDVSDKTCRAYAATKAAGGARKDLEIFRAAINYWNRSLGPLSHIPIVTLPRKAEPKDRWLTREEARRLRSSARHTPHLYRFCCIGFKTKIMQNGLC